MAEAALNINDNQEPQETPPPQQPPVQQPLPAEQRAKLDGIVVQMYKQNASKDEIQAVVDHFKTNYSGTQPAAKPEETKDISSYSGFGSRAFDIPGLTKEDQRQRAAEAVPNINKAFSSKETTKALNQMQQDEYQKTINQTNLHSTSEVQPLPKPDIKLLPSVVSENSEAFKDVTNPNSLAGRQTLKSVLNTTKDENFKNNLSADLAAYDHQDKDPVIAGSLHKKIKSGKYGYDPVSQRPTVKMNPAQAFIDGVEKTYQAKQKADWLASASPEEIAVQAEKEREQAKNDWSTPIAESAGWNIPFTNISTSKIANTIGENANAFAKAGAATSLAVGTLGLSGIAATPEFYSVDAATPLLKPTLGALFIAHDAGKQAAGQTFDQVYNEQRDKGFDPQVATQEALHQAQFAGATTAAQMGLMGLAGLKLGEHPLPGTVWDKGLKQIIKSHVQNIAPFLKRIVPEAGVQGSIAGAVKGLQNLDAGKPVLDGTGESAMGAAAFVSLLSAVGGGLHALTPRGELVAMNGISKMNPDLVERGINQAVDQKHLTEQQAQEFRDKLNEQRSLNKNLPTDTPLENRDKIQTLITKRNALENQLDPDHPSFVDKAYHQDIKEEINGVKKVKADGTSEGKDGINERIRQLSQGESPNFHEDEKLTKTPLDRAKELIAEKAVDGRIGNYDASNPQELLKNIAEQAHGGTMLDGKFISSRPIAEETFGKELVDLAAQAHPEHIINEPKAEDVVPGKGESIVPNSEKINPTKELQTWDIGDMAGKPEDEAAKKHLEGVVKDWDTKPAGKEGETFGEFVQRVIPHFDQILKSEAKNTTVITHSSVLKAFKVWDEMGRPEIDKLTPEQKTEFADAYNKEETHNADLETFKGTNGDIHVIRHGQTEDNEKNNFRSGDTNLTEKGIKQAQAVGQELKEKTGGDVPKIITSDLPRAIHTSNLITDELDSNKAETRSDADIEKRMLEIEKSPKDYKEFNELENEMQRRERSSVFDVPLDKVNDAVDALMKKEKDQPNGWGSFMEKRDARETKEVADKYLNPKEISDQELKNDFKDAVMGNPDTWYADGLKLRESMKEAASRGIETSELVSEVEKAFIKDHYSAEEARAVVARKLKPIFETSKNKDNAIQINPTDEVGVRNGATVGETVGAGNTEPKEPTGESGSGGQPPTEEKGATQEEEDAGLTSIRNSVTEEKIKAAGLTQPITEGVRTFGSVWEEAKAKIADGYDVNHLMQDLEKNPNRPLSDLEDALLTYHNATKEAELFDINKKINEATEKGDVNAADEYRSDKAKVLDDLQHIYNIDKQAGAANARGLNARKLMVDRKYSLASMMAEKQASENFGEPLDKEQQAEVEKQFEAIKEANKKLTEYTQKLEAENARLKAEKEFNKSKPKKPSGEKTTKDYEAERQKILDDYKAKKASDTTKRQGAGITDEDVKMVARLLKSYAEQGLNELASIVNNIKHDIKGLIPDITDKDIHNIIAGEYNPQKPTKSELTQKLSDLKTEAKLVNKIEEIQKGPKPKNSKAKLEQNKKLYDLRQQIKELKNTPAAKTEAAKERIQKQIFDLNKKIANKDYSTTVKKEPPVLDKEGFRLKAEYEKAKDIFDQDIKRNEIKNATPYKRFLRLFVRGERAFKLSNPVTIGKLASAAATRMATAPIEEGVGAVWSKILPKSITSKATGEAGFHVKALAKGYTQAMMQGIKEAGETARGIKTSLEANLGKKGQLPPEALDFFGQLHSALKAPVKRFAFERSYEKRMKNNIKNGVNVDDPMVKARISVEAYQDANRAIFMQDNWVSKGWTTAVRSLENSNNKGANAGAAVAQWLLPFVKVPTNIVAETAQHTFGLASGIGKLIRVAASEGLKNVSQEDAESIMRSFKKGSVGAAAMTLGFLNPKMFGGYYMDKDEKNRNPKDVKAGETRIHGIDIPAWVQEAPVFQAMQFGATIRRLADGYMGKKPMGLGDAALGASFGLLAHEPLWDEPSRLLQLKDPNERKWVVGELAKSTIVPSLLDYTAKATDPADKRPLWERFVDPVNQRKPTGKDWPTSVKEHIQSGIPVLNQKLELKKSHHGAGDRF